MAEFQVVAKEIERLCKTYQDKCRTDECPLYLEDLCYAQAMSYIHKYDADNLENTVMAWAAEHSEPVYPTWADWFRQIGIASRTQSCFHQWLLEPIPADIAEKIGLKPKEDV